MRFLGFWGGDEKVKRGWVPILKGEIRSCRGSIKNALVIIRQINYYRKVACIVIKHIIIE